MVINDIHTEYLSNVNIEEKLYISLIYNGMLDYESNIEGDPGHKYLILINTHTGIAEVMINIDMLFYDVDTVPEVIKYRYEDPESNNEKILNIFINQNKINILSGTDNIYLLMHNFSIIRRLTPIFEPTNIHIIDRVCNLFIDYPVHSQQWQVRNILLTNTLNSSQEDIDILSLYKENNNGLIKMNFTFEQIVEDSIESDIDGISIKPKSCSEIRQNIKTYPRTLFYILSNGVEIKDIMRNKKSRKSKKKSRKSKKTSRKSKKK